MKRLLFLPLLLFALPSSAQTTLEEYRALVDAYSWQLRISAARSEAAVRTLERTRTGFLPRLSLDGSFTANVRHTDGVKHWTFELLPQIVQTLYGGGAVRAAFRQAELDCEIALCNEEFSRIEVNYAAEYAYWNLSAMNLYVASMREYVAIIRSLKEVVDRRFAEGYIAKGDVLMIDTRLSEAEYELLAVERSAAVALHDFNVLRGVDPAAAATLGQSIRDSLELPERIPAVEATLRRPDYMAAVLAGERAEVGVRAARAPFDPQVSIGIGAPWRPYSPNRNGSTYLDGIAFVKLSVPIFHWGERRHAMAAARAVQLESEWSAAQLHDDIVRAEADGWTALVKTRSQVAAAERNLRIAGENLSISTYSYGEGAATILDVLQAQLSWIQLYTNAIRSRFDYAVAVSDYRRITAQ